MNIAAIYTAARGRLPWTTEQLMPYVVHTYQDTTKPKSWFFDTFLLLDLKVKRGSTNAYLVTSVNATTDSIDNEGHQISGSVGKKDDWEQLIDSYFSPINGNNDSILKRLDDCIAAAKLELGNHSFKHRVFLAVPEPITYVKYYVDGAIEHKHICNPYDPQAYTWGYFPDSNEELQEISFSRKLNADGSRDFVNGEPACDMAINWFIDECVERWGQASLPNLELAGFYWVGENRPGLYVAYKTFLNFINRVHGYNLLACISLYSTPYVGAWNSNSPYTPYRDQMHNVGADFDHLFAQPNYSLGAGHESHTYQDLLNVVSIANNNSVNIVIEMDENCLTVNNTGNLFLCRHCRVMQYLEVLQTITDMDLFYYLSGGLLAYAYDTTTNTDPNTGNTINQFVGNDYHLFDCLAEFVTNRRREEAISRVDVNQDGIVDVADFQIVQNVMMGTDTDPDHVARADVNKDGVIDISDCNIVQSVVLNGLNL